MKMSSHWRESAADQSQVDSDQHTKIVRDVKLKSARTLAGSFDTSVSLMVVGCLTLADVYLGHPAYR